MTRLESGVDVNVPVTKAYNQWTQFEDFPRFMKHVESVSQLDDKHLHWRVKLGGQVREFDAEIVEQIPDKRIAWRSLDGARHGGVVTFHRLDAHKCRVMLQLEYEPQGLLENAATLVGVPQLDIEKDMARFVEFIEKRGDATGAWRGKIANKDDAAKIDGALGQESP
jgi:uncharacterized membrane protein